MSDFIRSVLVKLKNVASIVNAYMASKPLALYRKQQATGVKKYIYIFPLRSKHLGLRCSNFFKPPKKNSFGRAANKKIGSRKSQRLISTPMYIGLKN
jgi:hypothetical protein